MLLADREWLRQMIESLIDNALRHATGLTGVSVALALPDAGRVEITVTDDGPGFPGSGEDLFERFRRESPSGEAGFGIGLALARWVVERHDGVIRLRSGPGGRGAQVALELPVLGSPETAPKPAIRQDDPDGVAKESVA